MFFTKIYTMLSTLTSKTVNQRRSTHTKFATKEAFNKGACFAGEWIVTCGPRRRPGTPAMLVVHHLLFQHACDADGQLFFNVRCMLQVDGKAQSGPDLSVTHFSGLKLPNPFVIGSGRRMPRRMPTVDAAFPRSTLPRSSKYSTFKRSVSLTIFFVAKQVLQGQTTRS